MMRNIDLPEIGPEEPKDEPRPFNMPKQDHSPAARGCAVLIVGWFLAMCVLLVVAMTGGLARLAFWAVGA